MPSHRLFRLAFLAAMTAALPAWAEKTAVNCPPRPIVVGLYEFGFYYHAGAGLDKDVAEQLQKRSGCSFDLRVMPRRAIWQAMQSGSVDMTLSAAATPERLMFAWAFPYLWSANMAILRKEVNANVRSTTDFLADPSLRLGIGRGFVPGVAYDEFVSQLRNIGRVEDVDDAGQMYAMFKAGRFQAILGSQMVYASYLKDEIQNGQVRIEDWGKGKSRGTTNLLVSKKTFNADDARHWGELLKSINTDGTMQRMVTRYLDAESAARIASP
jgi:polar amino acid transport system substrate-binding protein